MKHLKLLLKSLLKNEACVTGGRTYPWWVAVIFFILSTAISLIPTTVALYTVDAGVMIKSAAYDTDKGFYEILKTMEIDGIDLKFYNEHTVENFNQLKDSEGNPIKPYIDLVDKDGNPIDWKHVDENGVKQPYEIKSKVITEYTTKTEEGQTETTITKVEEEISIFKLYIMDDLEAQDMNKKVNAVLQDLNPYIFDEAEGVEKTRNSTSFAIFGKTSFVWIKYNSNKNVDISTGYSPVGQFSGTYRDIKCVDSLLDLKGTTLTETVNKTAVFFKEGYNELMLNNAAIQLAVYLAINAGIVLLMGFILWLMTRGKNNPYRTYKIYETMGISCWTAFTPALISMLIGFIMGAGNSMSAFMFVLVFGVRSMWLAMKNLRPAINN